LLGVYGFTDSLCSSSLLIRLQEIVEEINDKLADIQEAIAVLVL